MCATRQTRGTTEAIVRWDNAFLDRLVVSALVRYLAVAHYGRGRGEWQESEYPLFWRDCASNAVAAQQEPLAAIWALRTTHCESGVIEARLRETVANLARGCSMGSIPAHLSVCRRGRACLRQPPRPVALHPGQRMNLHDFNGGLRDVQMRMAFEWLCRHFVRLCLLVAALPRGCRRQGGRGRARCGVVPLAHRGGRVRRGGRPARRPRERARSRPTAARRRRPATAGGCSRPRAAR